jgi:metal-responsive CopG/Arc/MetJ family transcriptional regulator
MSKRVRLTVSLPADLVRRIDSGRRRGQARSRAVEEMLEEAERRRAQAELDEEIRAYYAVPPTPEEEEFTRALGRIARTLQIDEPRRRRKR